MSRAERQLPWLLLLAACSEGPLSREERLDPASCAGCHPEHYREWSGSMHAYASADPVFRAMNARGLREAGIGDFCVRCHAPMALAEGATSDGSNLDSVPAALQGITCVFCHQIEAVTGEHNAALSRADDEVFRGGIADPVHTPAHGSVYSALHDRNTLESSRICGACHDVVTPAGVHLERGFLEWKSSLYSTPSSAERVSCQGCHMPGTEGRVAEVGRAPVRRRKSHAFPAVDLALTPFPEIDAQRELVRRELATVVQASLCVLPFAGGATIAVTLENVAAGHHFPSGASHDRRVWLEIAARSGGRELLRSGFDGPEEVGVWRFGDRAYRADGEKALMFWDVARIEPEVLPAPTTRDPLDPRFVATHRTRSFVVFGPTPEEVRATLRMLPIAREVLESLVASGDLAREVVDRMPIHELEGARLLWRATDGKLCTN